VVLEDLELDLLSRLLRDELVGPRADRLGDKALLSDLFVIIRRYDPAGAADIGGAHQSREVEERSFEFKLNRALVEDLDPVGLVVQQLGPGPLIVLVAPFDIVRRDRRSVMKLDALAQPEGGTSRVLGKLVALGQRGMVIELVAKVLDHAVLR